MSQIVTSPLTKDTGIVLRVDAKVCHVEIDDRVLQLPLAGKLFEDRSTSKRPVAVGDRVRLVRGSAEGDYGVIDEVLPRSSKLARRGMGNDEREQVLAANVSMVLIVAALRDPPFQPLLVDRILAAAEREKIPAAVVLTKVDRDRHGDAELWHSLYAGLGYPTFVTSIKPGAETKESLAALHELLRANVSVLTGLSGAGKSSLLNTLIPGLQLRVGSLGRIQQGKHTTTHTQLIPLPGGGHVLDTPGIRSFGLFATDATELTFYFREFRALVGQCEYRNCSHRGDPNCAILTAVERGEIALTRFDSYMRIYDDLTE